VRTNQELPKGFRHRRATQAAKLNVIGHRSFGPEQEKHARVSRPMRSHPMRSPFVRPAHYKRAPDSRTFPARRLNFAVSVRAVLLMLAGASLFLLALLCTIALLAESHCGERFGYYGCDLQH
jgi:hypothetical protein